MLPISAERIKAARKSRGLSLEAAASAVGAARSTYIKWERGERQPRNEAARRLAEWVSTARLSTDEPERGETKRALTISVPVPHRMADIAAEMGIDLTELFATLGMEAVRAELKRRFSEHDREAVEQQNAYFAEHGLPLAQFRTW